MNKKFRIDLFLGQDVLFAIDRAPYKETFYGKEGLADYKQKPYKFYVWTITFGTRKTPKGNVVVDRKSDIKELSGMTHREIAKKLDEFVNGCEGVFDNESPRVAVPKDWIPEKWKAIEKGLKMWRLANK